MNQDYQPRQAILVTGVHRSGTTWVGKMLAANHQVAFISEPLNLWHRPGVMRVPVGNWYPYICEDNEVEFLPALQETLNFRYHPWDEIKSLRSVKDGLRMRRDWSIFLKGKVFHQRPLLKDPFAIFSAAWFVEKLGCAVVIVVRHPAGFTSSLIRLGWVFDFGHLLAQPLLMRDWLEPYRAEMEAVYKVPDDIVMQGSLLWRIIYQVVGGLKERYPQFIVIRHEDLSVDPLAGYRELYASLGLNFSPQVQQAILNSSKPENPGEVSRRAVHSVHLDSRANLANWKRRLTVEEIERIRYLTADVAAHYYTDQDW
ncbi:MAG TPA: sulfotransferase [Anaerolineales bacterium]|nr:sulfotransferase [Anaerolineales bacterium]